MTFPFHLRNEETENNAKKETWFIPWPNMALGGAQEEEALEQELFMMHQGELQIARPAQPAEPT